MPRQSAPRTAQRILLFGLLNLYDPIYGGVLEALRNSAWPANLDVVDFCLGAKAKVRTAIARRHEPDTGGHVVIDILPDPVVTLMVAPIPSRLLLCPRSSNMIQ